VKPFARVDAAFDETPLGENGITLQVESPMETFDSVAGAVSHVVMDLIANQHSYILNIRGPGPDTQPTALQIVPRHFVYGDGDLGLTLHLPCDPTTDEAERLAAALDLSVFDKRQVGNIPCYAYWCGTDVNLVYRMVMYVLEKLHGYSPETKLTCEVHDEGPLEVESSEGEQSKKVYPQRVVCITLVPAYNQPLYTIDKGVEAKVIELLTGLGPYCRVSKHQWLVATNEPCGGIWQELEHTNAGNVLVFAFLMESEWKFSCNPNSEIDEWEFDGLAAFFQQKLSKET
jgi:hypothetical protein